MCRQRTVGAAQAQNRESDMTGSAKSGCQVYGPSAILVLRLAELIERRGCASCHRGLSPHWMAVDSLLPISSVRCGGGRPDHTYQKCPLWRGKARERVVTLHKCRKLFAATPPSQNTAQHPGGTSTIPTCQFLVDLAKQRPTKGDVVLAEQT